MQPFYPAKLLLFGEYTVLSGSQALAIPIDQWKGQWEHANSSKDDIASLKQYADWLLSNEIISASAFAQMLKDADDGWKYSADIPIGFGLGSSGAYVAALYDRYVSKEQDIASATHAVLAKMEGYFHGSSSGMDPLVSFTNKALYKSDGGNFHTISNPGWPDGFNFFLVDTGMARSTGSLVNTYREMLKEYEFKSSLERDLIPMVEHAIHFYLLGLGHNLETCLQLISEFQRKHFSSFIPAKTKILWDELRDTTGLYIKFCGAGGGGYFMAITTPSFNGELPENFIQIN